jgi:TonB-dependent receptor
MIKSVLKARVLLLATTALGFSAGFAAAQTDSTNNSAGAVNLDLGSVEASGYESATGSAAPSGTGSRQQAQELKKLAPNVVSVLPQSVIQENPDVNVADAFSRIPGVALTSDSGEGQFINIRGLNPDLNGTLFDGIHLTSNGSSTPTNGQRAPDLSAFPDGIIGGVEVVKSLTPDIDAEGLGGSANLLPITLPANGGPMLNITAAAGAETLRPTGIFDGNIQIGDSFAIPGMRNFANSKPFSFVFGYSYYGDRRGIDDFEEAYDPNTYTADGNNADLDNLQARYYQEHRVRQGEYLDLEFNPSPQTGLFFRALHSGYRDVIDKDRLELSNTDAPNASGPDGAVGSDGDFTDISGVKTQARYTHSLSSLTTDVLEFGGHTVLDNFLNVNATTSFTQGSTNEPYDYVTEFKGPKVTINYNVTNPQYRTFSVPSGVNLADPSLYNLPSGNLTNNPQYTEDQEFAEALNASFANSLLGGIGDAKFGAEARLRSEGTLQYNYANPDDGPNLGSVTFGNPELDYYNAHYVLPPFPNYAALLGQTPLIGATSNPNDPNDPTGLAYANYQANISAFQHNTENVYAGYGQETLEFGKFEVLGGVRVEDTNGTYRAYAATDTGAASTVNGDEIYSYAPNVNKQDYINVFPSAQLKYAFNNQFQVRAAYSTAIARPGFNQISAATTTVAGGGSNGLNAVTIGNPNLKPTTGNSFDLTAEYYGPHDSYFSGNLFYKTFKNYVFQTINNENVLYQGAETLSQVTSYQNESGAYAEGLELDAHRRFYELISPFDGIGIDGNITFVNSSGHSDGPGVKAYQLPQTSPITYNATLFYQKGPFYADVSVNYVSRSLFAVVNPGTSGFADTNPRDADNFTSARTTVDANLEYNVTPRVTFFVQARNITNSPLEFTQSASSQYPIQREFYDLDYLGGVRLKLGS